LGWSFLTSSMYRAITGRRFLRYYSSKRACFLCAEAITGRRFLRCYSKAERPYMNV
jgi:hypothetical protein